MDFKSMLSQIERPYWSPMHPRHYIKGRVGWGIVYPDDIGAFNLMWLMSGCGQPPDDYARYSGAARWVLGYSNVFIGRQTIKDLAALRPLNRFADIIFSDPIELYEPLRDALRLRV